MSAFPTLARTRVTMALDLRGWAVFAGEGEADTKGQLFEGRPAVADHVFLWSTGDEVHMQPHYTFSTWDEFWSDAVARIHATGFGGVFPFTLGDQKTLRDGFLSVLDRAATILDPTDPASAAIVRTCAARIRAVAPAAEIDDKST
jgi:hypothetical protein